MRALFAFFIPLIFLFVSFGFQVEAMETFSVDINDSELLDRTEKPPDIVVSTPMTPEQIDDLFGPEPYLGPTSWLGSKNNK